MNHRDPSGLIIAIHCSAEKALKGRLRLIGITDDEYSTGKVLDLMLFSGQKVNKENRQLYTEIISDMMSSSRLFEVIGGTAEIATRMLERHIKARMNIVRSAQAKRFRFGEDRFNPTFWTGQGVVRQNKNPSEALEDIWDHTHSGLYSMGCSKGTNIVQLRGILHTVGPNVFDREVHRSVFNIRNDPRVSFFTMDGNVNVEDWIPGDSGFVKNEQDNQGPLQEGENIIYVGNNLWWGHIERQPVLLPLPLPSMKDNTTNPAINYDAYRMLLASKYLFTRSGCF